VDSSKNAVAHHQSLQSSNVYTTKYVYINLPAPDNSSIWRNVAFDHRLHCVCVCVGVGSGLLRYGWRWLLMQITMGWRPLTS